ncbi:hypothetical protein FPZ41_06050 [Streptomyces sp. K1PN6]|uniref:Uncharacterized protein n=1 Tax=Streptomyces acidicola TaxID=2596892 RepID=A0A5N8WPK2_9ACTN|nr:hypothetical protein [Streptomyces acidicola]
MPGSPSGLHLATVAVAVEVPLKRLRHAIACFPTVSKIWLFSAPPTNSSSRGYASRPNDSCAGD